MSRQPRDDANYPIPLLSYRLNGGQALVVDAVPVLSSRFAASVRVVSLYTTADCFFEIGDANVQANTSNSHFLPSGIYIDAALGSEVNAADNAKYISTISAGSAGILYVSERT